MKKKGIIVRVGYTLLGSLLTLCIMLIRDQYIEGWHDEETALLEETVTVEEMPILEAAVADYKAEVDVEELQVKEDAENEVDGMKPGEKIVLEDGRVRTVSGQEIVEVSANHILAAPVRWKEDYPAVSSEKLLAEKEQERSSYEETLAVNEFDKQVIANSTIDFSDVKITILGDSISAGNTLDEEDEEYSYPEQLKEILGCKEVLNLSIGGSSVSELGDNAMVNRWREIPKDSDIIIVFGGTNDMLFENKWDFGFVEYDRRMKGETFCGDFDTLVSKIEYRYLEHNKENYSKLLCINPPSTIKATEFYNIRPDNLIHQSQFAAAINQIAPEYSFEVIDFYNNNILNTHDSKIVENFMPDGIHGNPEGYRIMAEHIASQIIQRIEQ